ncbi:MAG TPA: type II toxin-antitoxin system RelE/ParE family toxin [Candidatus Nanoarchaeia archaeon]|nr:type II toxin-antitoxin system RelE/ParE family toxin [Candidatus Nanoarchaeia archaeon]
MNEWIIKLHPEFLNDLERLDQKHIEIFYKKKTKIKENPLRLKHLSGGENCYREEITRNIRLIYFVEKNNIWFLTIGPHDKAYQYYIKRLHSLKNQLS